MKVFKPISLFVFYAFFIASMHSAVAQEPMSEKDMIKTRLKQLPVEQYQELIQQGRVFDPKMTKVHAAGKEAVAQIDMVDEVRKKCGGNFSYNNNLNSSNVGWPTVSCKYHPSEETLGGSTNKFLCDFVETKKDATTKIKTRKVKYKAFTGIKNSELVPTLLAGNLAMLIGFQTDIYCPAHIVCENCASNMPYEFGKGKGAASENTFTFKDAMVEFEADLMSVKPNIPRKHDRRPHGVSFKQIQALSASSPEIAKAMAIEREAWLLWLNFLVEMDPHSSNQRVGCDKGKLVGENGVECEEPYVYTVDYGQSFFRRFQFEKWSQVPILIQEQDGACRGGMTFQIFKDERNSASKEIYMEPKISQEAKELLESRLLNISDKQWLDLLRFANTERLFGVKPEAFLGVVKKKIEDLSQVRCASFEAGLSVMASPQQ